MSSATKNENERPRPEGRRTGTPPRSIPWWMLVGFVAVAGAGVWMGVRFGEPIERGLGEARRVLWGGDDAGSADDASRGEGETAQYYTCGMHPWVILPHPGDCPICHMELTPLDPAKFTGEVVIDPVVVQNIGVRVAPVAEGPLERTIRTVGTVDYDETRVRDVNTKISGWIEDLYVDYVGAEVGRGDPLFEVYSPALLAAQEEYLLALRSAQGGDGGTGTGRPLDLVASSRTKLELSDMTPEQIDAIAESGEASRTVTVLSPHGGVVIAKHANEGMKIDPGMQVFRIADLSRVWVLVTLYESQLPFVAEGQTAIMSLPYIPGQTFEGRVVYVYPYVDPKTREVQVRLEFENPTGLLKPGMFTTVELRSVLKQRAVLVPRGAVLRTGERSVAFVSHGEGRFEPREVRLGADTGRGEVEVLEGLSPGEMVVTSGQFLLDSEARMREALAKMMRGEMAADQVAAVAHAAGGELRALPEPLAEALSGALAAYMQIGDRLAADTAEGIADPARALADALDGAIAVPIPEDEHFWHRHTEAAVARGAALELIEAADLVAAREVYARLSVAMDTLIRATGVPPQFDAAVQSLHCPMFREGQGGAIWLQAAGGVRNPFFGSSMLECFDRREAIPVTGTAAGADDGAAPPEPEPEPAGRAAAPAAAWVDDALDAYLVAQERLTMDDAAGAAEAISRLRTVAAGAAREGPAADAAGRLAASLDQVRPDLGPLREAFGRASQIMLEVVETSPPAPGPGGGLFHTYCPMVKQAWLQTGDEVRNPYDPGMLSCGTIVGEISTRTPGEAPR